MDRIERKYDVEVGKLLVAFAETRVGQTVYYADMAKLTGLPINGSGHAALSRALRDALKQGIVMFNVANQGYQRANDIEKAAHTRHRVLRTQRMAKRGLRVARCVDRTNLDSPRRLELMAAESILSTVARETHGNHLNAAAGEEKRQHNFDSAQRLARARALARFDS